MRLVSEDDPAAAAVIREVDLQKKFRMQPTELAKAVGMTPPKCGALRAHLGIDSDDSCRHVFKFKRQKIACYSNNALRKITEALKNVEMIAVWAKHRPRKRAAATS